MAAKSKKIDRDYVLSDSSVNCYGFRLLTSGYMKEEFAKNPIGYYMHDRGDGVVVRWEDLRVEGDRIVAKPVINLVNERGPQTLDEVENGFLNGASVGHIVALEISEDPNDMLPGQTGPTIKKWYNREASLVDVPGNMNSLALYDKEGNMINLADFKIQKSNMKQVILTAAQLSKLNLTAESNEQAVDAAIDGLLASSQKIADLQAQVQTLTQEKTQAVADLANFKKQTAETTVKDLVDNAVKEKRITVELGNQYKSLFADKPEDLKKLLDAQPAYQALSSQTVDNSAEIGELMKLSADELFTSGKLDRLKNLSAQHYAIKYKELTGQDVPAQA